MIRKIRCFTLLMLLCIIRSTWEAIAESEMTRINKEVFKNYDIRAIPIRNGKPLLVQARVYLNNMVPRKKMKMHYSMDLFMTLWWRDYRLKFNSTSMGSYTYLPYDHNLAKKVWKPNINFVGSKYGYHIDIPQDAEMIMLYPNGNVGYNYRVKMDGYCHMDLTYFPFDKQTCKLIIESCSYNTDFVRLRWYEGLYNKEMHKSDFKTLEFSFYENPDKKDIVNEGKKDQLIMQVVLHRNTNLYIVRDFFPCALIVVFSWLSFWITYRSTPARVALGITTVLTVVTMTNGVRANSQSSGLIRAIDIYMFCCNLFVFLALGQAALVGMTAPSEKHACQIEASKVKKSKENNQTTGLRNLAYLYDEGGKSKNDTSVYKRRKSKKNENYNTDTPFNPLFTDMVKFGPVYFYKDVHIVDKISRILFPVTFILFNITFFCTYILLSKNM